jgi:hypothetical protein
VRMMVDYDLSVLSKSAALAAETSIAGD